MNQHDPASRRPAPPAHRACPRPWTASSGGTSDRKLICLVKTETVGDLALLIYESIGE
jgi:hypothetical protein